MIGTNGAFQINPRWSYGWNVMAQSDKAFAYRYGIEGYDGYNITNQVYLTGLHDRNYFDLSLLPVPCAGEYSKFQSQRVAAQAAMGSAKPGLCLYADAIRCRR